MVDSIRGLVRPIVTIGVVAALIGFVAAGIAIPEQFWSIATVIVAFWFYDRAKKAQGGTP